MQCFDLFNSMSLTEGEVLYIYTYCVVEGDSRVFRDAVVTLYVFV